MASLCGHYTAIPPAANPEPLACTRWELTVTNFSRNTPPMEWWGANGSKTTLGVASYGTATVVLDSSDASWPGTVHFIDEEGPTSPPNRVVRVPTYKVRCLDLALNRQSLNTASPKVHHCLLTRLYETAELPGGGS